MEKVSKRQFLCDAHIVNKLVTKDLHEFELC